MFHISLDSLTMHYRASGYDFVQAVGKVKTPYVRNSGGIGMSKTILSWKLQMFISISTSRLRLKYSKTLEKMTMLKMRTMIWERLRKYNL